MKKISFSNGRAFKPLLPALAGLVLAACAQDGSGLLNTGSLSTPDAPVVAAKSSVDPQCVTLATEIETLKSEGSTARLEKVADGKSSAVTVKRASLAKQAHLNKANADFIAKCGPNLPRTAAAPAPQPAVAAAAPAKSMTQKAAAQVTTGVTVEPPSAATTIPAAQPKQ